MDLHWPCSCTAQSSILSIGSVSVALLLSIFLNGSCTVVAVPCFTVVKSFTSWYALFLLLFLRFSSVHYTVLLSIFLYIFHAPLDVVVHFLVFLRSFRLKSFLSQLSPFVAQIKNFYSDSGFFLSLSLLLVMVRGANFPPTIAWKLSNSLGSFNFSRSNLSRVSFGLLIFFRRRRKS